MALAAATLLIFLAAHAVRETARDALFLSDLAASLLPWAYLAIAAGALAVGAGNRRLLSRFSHRRLLVATLLAGGAVDLVFWEATSFGLPGMSFALYVWTGLLATAATLQLWLHLADSFDVSEAKRGFPWILAGGLAGSVIGSTLAAGLLEVVGTRDLLIAAAALGALAALPALRLAPAPTEQRAAEEPARGSWLAAFQGDRYLRGIVLLAGSVAMLATGIDFVFKRAVVEHVAVHELGAFFARYHAAVNLAALVFELIGVTWLLRTLGVTRALGLLPALLLAMAVAGLAAGGFVVLLALKATDVVFRQSLHGAGTEVLYQPLSAQARNLAKTAVESIGKRGGQAAASLLLLAALAGGADNGQILWGIVALCLVTVLTLPGLRREYVARFRNQLEHLGAEARADVPRLELHSLEVLVTTLSSPDDSEVLAAMNLLESYDRTSLISPLLLHHPSRRVVLRALDVLQGEDHPHLDAILDRLLEHDDPGVRAAALNARAARDPSADRALEMVRNDDSPEVRATALVVLAAGAEDAGQIRKLLTELIENRTREERIAVARSLPRLPFDLAQEFSAPLIEDPDPSPATELARALVADPDPHWLPTLVELLSRREARPAARAALLALGSRALAPLARALKDPEVPMAVRRHLPRTIHRFRNAQAAAILTDALPGAEPIVRYKILRALGRMRSDDPELAIREEPLWQEANRSLERAIAMLYFRVAHAARTRLAGRGPQEGFDLLESVLTDKEQRALERVFRVLHILEPQHDFAAIFEALRDPDTPVQAGALELLEHLVERELRAAVLALLGEGSAADRLRAALGYGAPPGARELLKALEGWDPETSPKRSEPVRAAVEPLFEQLEADPDPILASIARQWREREGGSARRAAADGS